MKNGSCHSARGKLKEKLLTLKIKLIVYLRSCVILIIFYSKLINYIIIINI